VAITTVIDRAMVAADRARISFDALTMIRQPKSGEQFRSIPKCGCARFGNAQGRTDQGPLDPLRSIRPLSANGVMFASVLSGFASKRKLNRQGTRTIAL